MKLRINLITLCGPLLWMTLVSGVHAQTPSESPESWTTPLVISAADFRTNGANRESFYFSSNGYITGDGTTVVLIAPVYLPNGSTVRAATAYAYDNTNSCAYPDVTVWLNRVGANTGTGNQTMASMTTSGALSGMQDPGTTSISYAEIDTFRYTYYAVVMLCSGAHELHSVAVFYEE